MGGSTWHGATKPPHSSGRSTRVPAPARPTTSASPCTRGRSERSGRSLDRSIGPWRGPTPCDRSPERPTTRTDSPPAGLPRGARRAPGGWAPDRAAPRRQRSAVSRARAAPARSISRHHQRSPAAAVTPGPWPERRHPDRSSRPCRPPQPPAGSQRGPAMPRGEPPPSDRPTRPGSPPLAARPAAAASREHGADRAMTRRHRADDSWRPPPRDPGGPTLALRCRRGPTKAGGTVDPGSSRRHRGRTEPSAHRWGTAGRTDPSAAWAAIAAPHRAPPAR